MAGSLHFRILRICAFQFLKPSVLCSILAFFYPLIETAENILQPGKLMTSLQFMHIAEI
jgi:hypothetical protein